METRKVSIAVEYIHSNSETKGTVEILVGDLVPITKADKREDTFRQRIKTLTGFQQKVMSDLYRHLVLGNFTKFNDKRGFAAEKELNRVYPDNGTLPHFEPKSWAHDAGGLIVYNLLKHRESNPDGYAVLGGILIGLLASGVIKTPQLDMRSAAYDEPSVPRKPHKRN